LIRFGILDLEFRIEWQIRNPKSEIRNLGIGVTRMNRYAAWMLAAGLAGMAVGCVPYRNMVDTCWPQRYNYTARREVVEGFAPQVQNGHVLDQTVWNYDFEKGSDQLNAMGMAKLDYMVRRRPAPDSCIFLATARDLIYDPTNAEAYGNGRRELDGKRAIAIQKYLAQQMVGRPMPFDVLIHDPFEVGLPAEEAAVASRAHQNSAIGTAIFGPGGATSGAGVIQTGPGTGAPPTPGAGGSGPPGAGAGTPGGGAAVPPPR
jgi:hypothetical protein